MDLNGNIISPHSQFRLHINQQTWEDVEEYKEEYAQILAIKELYRINFAHRGPQIHYRNFLVKHLKDAAIAMKLTHCTLHLAVYLLDIFMDNHSITSDRIMLLANCCLLIAGKVEEYYAKTPKIAELNWLLAYPYTIKDYKLLEIHILRYFNWNVMFPTVAHYVHYFLQAAVTKEDVKLKGQSVAAIVKEMHFTIRKYLDKILDDVHYVQKHKPSILSASIISIARQTNDMSEWHVELEEFTRYSLADIQSTNILLLQNLPLPCVNCEGI